MSMEPDAQLQVTAIHAIGDHPLQRDLCLADSLKHLLGQFRLGLEPNALGDARLLDSFDVPALASNLPIFLGVDNQDAYG